MPTPNPAGEPTHPPAGPGNPSPAGPGGTRPGGGTRPPKLVEWWLDSWDWWLLAGSVATLAWVAGSVIDATVRAFHG